MEPIEAPPLEILRHSDVRMLMESYEFDRELLVDC